jgi:predicted small lipoprotein YifL
MGFLTYVAVLAMTGCGDSGPTGLPSDIVAAAPDLTIAAGPAQVSVHLYDTRATGVVDLARGALRLDLEAVAPTGPVATEVLVIGDRAWTREKAGATWQSVDLKTMSLLSLPRLRSGDVRAAVDLVRGFTDIDVFGGLQVQEASTIRYDLSIDPSLAAQRAAPATAPRITELAKATTSPVRVDVYVDRDGRIRRLEVPEELTTRTPVTRPDGNRISATIDFERFGADASGLVAPT